MTFVASLTITDDISEANDSKMVSLLSHQILMTFVASLTITDDISEANDSKKVSLL